MGKFSGLIGFVSNSGETYPGSGIYDTSVIERTYCGDIQKATNRYPSDSSIATTLKLDNIFSFVMDPYIYANHGNIAYIIYSGTCWKVEKIDIQRPRITISVGGVYNGPKA